MDYNLLNGMTMQKNLYVLEYYLDIEDKETIWEETARRIDERSLGIYEYKSSDSRYVSIVMDVDVFDTYLHFYNKLYNPTDTSYPPPADSKYNELWMYFLNDFGNKGQ